MVIKTLCETLGFTKSKLSNVLKHLVYDGGRQSGIFKSVRLFNKSMQIFKTVLLRGARALYNKNW